VKVRPFENLRAALSFVEGRLKPDTTGTRGAGSVVETRAEASVQSGLSRTWRMAVKMLNRRQFVQTTAAAGAAAAAIPKPLFGQAPTMMTP
jgi:hypothetical protein